MISTTAVVAYMAFFVIVGFNFLFVNLLVGKFCRPNSPNVEKLEVYECGEPTIGSSFVQFDLRFYVVALLFIIFDVEVAFFFPWATVFGKSTQLMDPNLQVVAVSNTGQASLTPAAKGLYKELGVSDAAVGRTLGADQSTTDANQRVRESARQLALLSMIDIGAFFAVLLVGFAYVWKRGDLDWVRAVSRERGQTQPPLPEIALEQHPALSA